MDIDIVAVISFKRGIHPVVFLEDINQIADELVYVDFRNRELVCVVEEESKDELKSVRGVDSVTFSLEGDY